MAADFGLCFRGEEADVDAVGRVLVAVLGEDGGEIGGGAGTRGWRRVRSSVAESETRRRRLPEARRAGSLMGMRRLRSG